MDEGKFVADFVAKNIEKIWKLGETVFGKFDETVQVQLKTAYKDYLNNTQEKYSKAKSFFIRNQSVDLYSYYVPTGVVCGKTCFLSPSFKELIEHSKKLVIVGSGGCGKSVLMRHLFLDCIKEKQYAPILIELRDLNSDSLKLEQVISDTLDSYGFNTSGDYIEKAKKAGHFCFFLDGYDEVNHNIRKKLVKDIKRLNTKYKNCPVIVSSRPDDVFNGIEELSIFKVMPLSLDSATKLINKLPFDADIKEKFAKDLKDGLFEKHESFLSNPLLLSIMLLTYGENAEIPSKLSIFYNQAYEALFQRHDANKGGYSRGRLTELDIQDFSRVFSLFALQTYEKRLFKMPRTACLEFIRKSRDNLQKEFPPEDYLQDLLSAACLLIEDGLDVAFSHRSFQEYFVAIHISNAAPDIQEKLINRYCKNINSDNVMHLLYELNPDLVERVLIVPRLKKLFLEIGVKNKVGITHAAKYIKRVYHSLNVDKERLTASLTNTSGDESAIVHLAIFATTAYNHPPKEYFDNNLIEMYEKYGTEERTVRFETKNLTYKTLIMADTLNGRGAFSMEYIQAGYEAYKRLDKKHKNYSSNLDDLLGI